MSTRHILFILAALFTAAVLAGAVWLRRSAVDPLPVLGALPDFELLDSNARPFGLAAVEGRVWVAGFIFTTCTGPCPELTRKMAEVHRAFQGQDRVHQVTITVNPAYDSPDVMRTYAAEYEADTSRWHFLTGSSEAIHDLAVRGFKVGSVDDPVLHSTRLMLVDDRGRIRGYYDGLDASAVGRLLGDIQTVLRELPS